MRFTLDKVLWLLLKQSVGWEAKESASENPQLLAWSFQQNCSLGRAGGRQEAYPPLGVESVNLYYSFPILCHDRLHLNTVSVPPLSCCPFQKQVRARVDLPPVSGWDGHFCPFPSTCFTRFSLSFLPHSVFSRVRFHPGPPL